MKNKPEQNVDRHIAKKKLDNSFPAIRYKFPVSSQITMLNPAATERTRQDYLEVGAKDGGNIAIGHPKFQI